MKKPYLFLAGLACVFALPHPALALKIGNCDHKAHELFIRGEKQGRIVRPGDEIILSAPSLDVSLDGHAPESLDVFFDYCIWHGELDVQNRNALAHHHGVQPFH